MKNLFLFALLLASLISCSETTNTENTNVVEEKITEEKVPTTEAFDYEKFGMDGNKYIPKGINVGEKAPIIETIDINKKDFNSKEILKDKQIVVLFYRGEWCPACNKHLSNLQDSLQYILDENASVVVIGPESVAHAENTVKSSEATFTIISDTDNKIQTEFDVLFSVSEAYVESTKESKNTDIAQNNNQEEAQLPVPATYIINQKGEIAFKHFDYNYKNRASVKEIISNL